MSDLLATRLREIIVQHGRTVCDNQVTLRALLRDYLGKEAVAHEQRINVLCSAVQQRVVPDLLNPRGIPQSLLQEQLAERLQAQMGIKEDLSRWAVETWRVALGLADEHVMVSTAAAGSASGGAKPGAASVAGARSTPAPGVQPPDTQRVAAAPTTAAGGGGPRSHRAFGMVMVLVLVTGSAGLWYGGVFQRLFSSSGAEAGIQLRVPAWLDLQAGRSTKLRVGVTRRGARGPVELSFQDVPEGVPLAAATIPAESESIELEVAASGKTPATAARIVIVAVSGAQRAVAHLDIHVVPGDTIPEGKPQTPVAPQGQLPLTLKNTDAAAPGDGRWPETKPPGDGGRTEVSRPPLVDCTGKDGVSAAGMRKAQVAWAQYLGRQVEEEDEVAEGVKMKFVLVPPGKFWMGSPEGETGRSRNEVQHEVTITKPFYLARYTVTQSQYEALTGKSPSKFTGANLPVEQVSWDEADAFAKNWTKKAGGKRVYRLPTEAEWEYSCRGGRPSSQPFGIGDGTSLASGQANFDGNYPYGSAAKGEYREKTTPVGTFRANALGLYDMHGNVWQWCGDWNGEYGVNKKTDPTGPTEGSARVIRGGSWFSLGGLCRAACRNSLGPSFRSRYLGFRLASVPSEER